MDSSLAVLATSDGSLIKRFSQNVTSGALVESIYSSGAWKSYQLNTAGQQTPLSVIGWPRISLDTVFTSFPSPLPPIAPFTFLSLYISPSSPLTILRRS